MPEGMTFDQAVKNPRAAAVVMMNMPNKKYKKIIRGEIFRYKTIQNPSKKNCGKKGKPKSYTPENKQRKELRTSVIN